MPENVARGEMGVFECKLRAVPLVEGRPSMYSPSLKRTESESPIRVVFAAELSPKRTRGSRPASKPSACPAPLQPTGAPSVQTQPQQPHPFQAVQCQGLAKTCSHQRH